MTFLKQLVDGLNFAEYDIAGYEPTNFDVSIRSITFYHNLAFIEKGANSQPSSVLPPHPRRHRVWSAFERTSIRARAVSDDPIGRALGHAIAFYRWSCSKARRASPRCRPARRW